MTHPTRLLLGARRRALGHRLRPDQRARLSLIALVILACALLIGHLMAPGWLTPPPPDAIAAGLVPRAQQVPGASALEAAFWLTALASAIFGFRIMELLLRRDDVRQLQHLPLPPQSIFIDRLAIAAFEAALWALPLSALFIPLLWHDGALAALCAAALPPVGLLATLGVGVGASLYAARAEFGTPGHTGDGQTFLFAPGAALALSMILILLLKLGLGEALRLGVWSRAASLALGGALGLASLGLLTGWRDARRDYLRLLAGMREVDLTGPQLHLDYQISAFDKPTRLERLLSAQARHLYRRHALQYGRRAALARTLYGLGWLLWAVALWGLAGDALPSWACVGAPLLTLASLANPWGKLRRPGMAARATMGLPIARDVEDLATAWFAAREALLFVTPLALLTLALRTWRGQGVALAASEAALILIGALALHAAAWTSRRLPPLAQQASAALAACALAGCVAAWGHSAAWGVAILGLIFAALTLRLRPSGALA